MISMMLIIMPDFINICNDFVITYPKMYSFNY